MAPILEMKGITKRFPGVIANDRVDFQLAQGEVHALLGENGAGKSTLMNVLYGLYRPDEGQLYLKDRPVQITKPSDAIRFGIGMVHQDFMLVPVMTVAENLIIGKEITRWGPFLALKEAARKIRVLSDQYGLDVDPEAIAGHLPVGIRQRLEILKILYRDADILILDEPTAVLAPEECDSLFRSLSSLTGQGKSVIFITHKLKEVMRIADRITIMRNGKVVRVSTPAETSESRLASLMVGREVALAIDKTPARPGEVVLQVQNLMVEDDQGKAAVREVSFCIRSGEILGLAGVHGNGQAELIMGLTGTQKCASGKIVVDGNDLTNQSPRKIFECGVAHIPEDRLEVGMVENFTVADNLILNTYHQEPFSRKFILRKSARENNAYRLRDLFDIRPPDIFTRAGHLSGGNQQKMVTARELSHRIKLLVAAHPTRGLDIGSTDFIHNQILSKRDQGCAIFLVSADLDEIFTLADRIAVIYKGKIVDIVDSAKARRETIGFWMAGGEKRHEGGASAT
ncbi:ABC transporter ATP-binding protein [Thermodesulfobacteriota bacterium]